PAQHARLGKVADAAHHLLAIINDILDLSKIEAGKLELEAIDFALDTMLTRVCSLVGADAKAKGLELVINTDHLPRMLHGDPTRLSQALLNLLSNAVKFTASGSVTLSGELIERRPNSLLIRFEVRDTGIGIAADKIPGLFSAFAQADTSTSRRFGGTGLGLSITRQLAGLMGGESGVESEPGVGSRFWFTARLGRARGDARSSRDALLSGSRALLVEDLKEARDAMAEMLEQLGLRVDAIASGEEAIAKAAEADAAGDPYLVCVLAWNLPGIDGIETCRRLKADDERPDLRCVIVTSHDESGMWGAAREQGIRSVLLKPVSASALHDALSEALAEGVPVDSLSPPTHDAFVSLQATRGGSRILLAEDNAVNQEVAVELLRSAGLVVDVASNGAQAVTMAKAGAYDLILMDVQMPDVDGLQATRTLRASGEGRAVPIVAMTANAFGEDRLACLAAGMDDHVAKPVDPDVLYRTLLRWLPQRQFLPAVAIASAADAQPETEPPSALQTRLAAIEGLDLPLGLMHFDGQMEMYVHVLRIFASTYATGMRQIDQALAAASHADLAAAGHSLRGACASIGATALEALAQSLESASPADAASHDAAAAAIVLQNLLTEMAGKLQHVLDEESDATALVAA
ncbi:MAG: response regulator, partial [Caldimonas sp.]